MTERTSGPTTGEASRRSGAHPPPEFVEAVKDALVCLYDLTKLSRNPLNEWSLVEDAPPGMSQGQALRQLLVDAIERMNPGPHVVATSRQGRAFRILELRYVEAMPFREVMETLAISQPQYHREQRYAIEMLATYLWETMPHGVGSGVSGGTGSAAIAEEEELSRVAMAAHQDDEVRLPALLNEVVGLMAPLAKQRRIGLDLYLPKSDLVVRTSRTALRHAIIGAISTLFDHAEGGQIRLSLEYTSTLVHLDVRTVVDGPAAWDAAALAQRLKLSRRLIRTLGGELQVTWVGDDVEMRLSFPVRRLVVVVIDDNPDLTQLIMRYLSDRPYSVLGASSAEEGVQLARQIHPDAIILDVMMPHQDGWDALQLLRHHPATSDIPIIICTILGEDALAESLGASGFIRKPVLRAELLQVLQRCLFERSPSAGDYPARPESHVSAP